MNTSQHDKILQVGNMYGEAAKILGNASVNAIASIVMTLLALIALLFMDSYIYWFSLMVAWLAFILNGKRLAKKGRVLFDEAQRLTPDWLAKEFEALNKEDSND